MKDWYEEFKIELKEKGGIDINTTTFESYVNGYSEEKLCECVKDFNLQVLQCIKKPSDKIKLEFHNHYFKYGYDFFKKHKLEHFFDFSIDFQLEMFAEK